jgi:ribose-phosphate pyrophosphokinase
VSPSGKAAVFGTAIRRFESFHPKLLLPIGTMREERPFLLFAGTSHPELAAQIAKNLGVSLGKVKIERFPDNEIGVHILESVRGRDVFVLQTIARQPDLCLMELLILVDAAKRASARQIIPVIPYFGYARQDRKGAERVPITAKLVADMLEKAGATRVLTMDLHAEQIQGFFDIPVDNLHGRHALIGAVKKLNLSHPVVVAPDIGSIKLARSFALSLETDVAIVDKHRVNPKEVEVGVLIGDVKNRDVLFVDDMCTTGGTLKMASEVCKRSGAKRLCAAVTHGLLVGSAFEESAVEKMIISNTVPLPAAAPKGRVEVVSVANLFGEAIASIVETKSIASLLE